VAREETPQVKLIEFNQKTTQRLKRRECKEEKQNPKMA
jgi:hypothetical protein